MIEASAILFSAANQVAYAPITLPAPQAGELIVETAYSCVSPGTELRCLAGQQLNPQGWGYIPGYALSGTVVACGPGTHLRPGDQVFCRGTQQASQPRMWGGHVSHALVAEPAVYRLPTGLHLRDAAMAALAAIALHGVRLSRPQIDERVAVIGLGPIGQLSARLHALAGAQVLATDRLAARVALLQAAGVAALVAGDQLEADVQAHFPDGADIVVDATGARSVVPQALALARVLPWGDGLAGGARYLLQGSYAGDIVLPYDAAFMKEIQVLIPRDMQPRDIRRALELIGQGALKVGDLITAVHPPIEAAQAYATLQAGNAMTMMFQWR